MPHPALLITICIHILLLLHALSSCNRTKRVNAFVGFALTARGGTYAVLCAEIHSGVGLGEPWFYFCPRQEREARGGRPSRTTPSGYWKAAGTPGPVYSADDRRAIGMKKTMVFYLGRAPSGTKTTWKMNEYRALHYDDPGAGAVGRTTDGSSSSAHAAAAPLHLPPQVTHSNAND